jgi:predicted nucleic acid-binding protein
MTISNIFLDTNILMELFFERAKREKVVEAVTALPEDYINAISILSLTTLLYYVESRNMDKTTAHAFLAGYKILDMNDDDYEWAKGNDEGDFEDALQVSCARRHGCGTFMTLDQKLEHMYGKYIQVQTIV